MTLAKLLCGIFVIAGTYILSKQMFENCFRKQINFDFKELPWYLQLITVIFGDKKKFESGRIWMSEPYPSPSNFSLQQKLELVAPFVGFLFICLGTIFGILL